MNVNQTISLNINCDAFIFSNESVLETFRFGKCLNKSPINVRRYLHTILVITHTLIEE